MLASYSRSFSGASQHSLNPGTASRKLLEVSFANSKKRSLSGCRVWVHEPGICVSYVRSPRTNPLREQSKFATTRWKVFISHCKISPSQAIFKVLQNNAPRVCFRVLPAQHETCCRRRCERENLDYFLWYFAKSSSDLCGNIPRNLSVVIFHPLPYTSPLLRFSAHFTPCSDKVI